MRLCIRTIGTPGFIKLKCKLCRRKKKIKVGTLKFVSITKNILKKRFLTKRILCYFGDILKSNLALAGVAQWIECWAAKPKGDQFNSQSGHLHRLQARSPVGGTWEATTHPSMSLSLSCSLPSVYKYIHTYIHTYIHKIF